jgi:Ca2+/Na+ antiporter
MKIRGLGVTEIMMKWSYLFTLAVISLMGFLICGILSLLGFNFLVPFGIFLAGFMVFMKMLLDMDKEWQDDLKNAMKRKEEKENGI